MKQVIVNVSGLSVEEKQRVNEALAKITGAHKTPVLYPGDVWFFAPDSLGRNMVSWDYPSPHETPTHTPQQVLEMAGMATKRKVRADFDPNQPIRVDVSSCTEEEKKEVQQAFFDVGIKWSVSGTDFDHLSAKSYTNSTAEGTCYEHLMFATVTRTDSINHKQFLELVYEPVQRGHVHADLMAMYAEDAKTTDKPWELWQFRDSRGEWRDLPCNPSFASNLGYRRKPKTHIVHGVEVPDLRIVPNEGESYWSPDPRTEKLAYGTSYWPTSAPDRHRISNNLCYEYTEEGKQAAILHAKAWLGIN